MYMKNKNSITYHPKEGFIGKTFIIINCRKYTEDQTNQNSYESERKKTMPSAIELYVSNNIRELIYNIKVRKTSICFLVIHFLSLLRKVWNAQSLSS